MTDPILHHSTISSPGAHPTRWALLLPGIYGAGRNWSGVLRKVVQERPEWGFVPVDLRGHGQSPRLSPPHTLAACTADVARLADTLPVQPQAVIGHSFGGKVALLYADEPDHHVEQCWIVDSTPAPGPTGGSAWGILDVLRGQPGPFETRNDGVQVVVDAGYDLPVAHWMGTNLRPSDDGDGFVWRVNPDQMQELLKDFFRVDAWPALEHPHGAEIRFLRATESRLLTPNTVHRLEAAGLSTGRIHLHDIEGGHWLNADNPGALVDHFAEFLG